MAKYDPLFEHLCRADDAELEMAFDDGAALVGGLPASAASHRAWWANETAAVTCSFSRATWRRGA